MELGSTWKSDAFCSLGILGIDDRGGSEGAIYRFKNIYIYIPIYPHRNVRGQVVWKVHFLRSREREGGVIALGLAWLGSALHRAYLLRAVQRWERNEKCMIDGVGCRPIYSATNPAKKPTSCSMIFRYIFTPPFGLRPSRVLLSNGLSSRISHLASRNSLPSPIPPSIAPCPANTPSPPLLTRLPDLIPTTVHPSSISSPTNQLTN